MNTFCVCNNNISTFFIAKRDVEGLEEKQLPAKLLE